MPIPPAPKNTRQITEHIKTVWDPRGKTVRAEYANGGTRVRTMPVDRECCALQDLLWRLEEQGHQQELPPAQAICDAIDARIEARPEGAVPRLKKPEAWLVEPFPRGPKPPRRRTKWTDVENGKQVHIYADTGRRWAHQPPHNEEAGSDAPEEN